MSGTRRWINYADCRIPAADRTVECRKNKNRSARSAVFRNRKVVRVGADVSDDTGWRAKRTRAGLDGAGGTVTKFVDPPVAITG